jgi:membrane protease YdiL (CAAX protease family)
MQSKVNWKQVGLFIGLTYGLSWLLWIMLWLTVGYESPAMIVVANLVMLMPAFSAILLGGVVFKDSPIHFQTNKGTTCWFFYYFLAYTLIYAVLAVLAIATPTQARTFNLVGMGLSAIGLLLVIVLRVIGGRDALGRVNLVGGKIKYWLYFCAGVILFSISQTLLNYVFNLGQRVDLAPLAQQAGMSMDVFPILTAVQLVLLSSTFALMPFFGEEYGWRVHLQSELIKLGYVRGVLLVGLIWGIWHAPAVMMGHTYPGQPVIVALLLFNATAIVMAFILGYAMLKSGSVWLVCVMHALYNTMAQYLYFIVYQPGNVVFSFGTGLGGLVSMGIIALLLLRDPIWRVGDTSG